jgi:hypothetical protein
VVPASTARWGEGGGQLLPRLLLFLRRLCSSRCGRGCGRASESSPRGRTEGAAPRLAAPPVGSGKSSPVGGEDGRRSLGGERMPGGERRERVGGEPGVKKIR